MKKHIEELVERIKINPFFQPDELKKILKKFSGMALWEELIFLLDRMHEKQCAAHTEKMHAAGMLDDDLTRGIL